MKHPDFADRFKRAVAHAQVDDTQEALSKLLDVSGVMIWSYRNGDKLPRMSTAVRIADRLGVNVNWLLSGSGPMAGGAESPAQGAREKGRPPQVVRQLSDLQQALLAAADGLDYGQMAELIAYAKRLGGGRAYAPAGHPQSPDHLDKPLAALIPEGAVAGHAERARQLDQGDGLREDRRKEDRGPPHGVERRAKG